MIMHCKAMLGREQPGQIEWALVWIMPQVQSWLSNVDLQSSALPLCCPLIAACLRCHIGEQYNKPTKVPVQNEWNEWCFRPWFCTVRLHWTGDNLGKNHGSNITSNINKQTTFLSSSFISPIPIFYVSYCTSLHLITSSLTWW